MTSPQSHRHPLRRSFGPDSFSNSFANSRQPSARNPFVEPARAISPRRMGPTNNEVQVAVVQEPPQKPPIPNAFEQEEYTTPLPVLSMIVLSITMLGEFLSANVSTPFILFMVRGFGELEDDAQVAFWTGIIVSSFFLTQFLTSLLWATVAEKYGRRLVLFLSLFGSAVACLVFGTATTISQAISIRLLQGVFAGAIGVARGSVGFMTDATNEGRAYAILGFCWGLGGVAGAIIGGSFERPADKWPGVFAKWSVFVKYPYLLPCALAAMITGFGSILSLFLNREGGPREGAIRLLPEKYGRVPSPIPEENESMQSSVVLGDEDQPKPTLADALRSKISAPLQNKLSGYFSKQTAGETNNPATPTPSEQPPMPFANHSARFSGSAYGYTGFRNRNSSNSTFNLRRSSLNNSMRRRRGNSYLEQENTPNTSDLNFAQRLLMANENAVTNIADLWVASAMNADNEEVFEFDSDTEDEGTFLSDEEDQDTGEQPEASPLARGSRTSSVIRGRTPSLSRGGSRLRPFGPSIQSLRSATTPPSRHASFSSTMPSIFAHPGVKTPAAVLDAQSTQPQEDTLQPIPESGRADIEQGLVAEQQPSLMSVIPVMIVVQYGLLALHSTTHDQVFVSYLVTEYKAGGLNLNAGHFAQLIALMSLAQIAYQFYLYPNIGPPRGRFSHLSMFRLGSLLFIPSYLTVILYRPFASAEDDGNFILMAALALSTAIRYCGITFAYTSISILLNYMTPPHAVGIANGIAQSIISLARFFGPILGGWLWSASVDGNPSGYPLGFLACAAACGLAVSLTIFIR